MVKHLCRNNSLSSMTFLNLLISPHPATRIAQRGRSFDGEEGKEAMTTNIIVNFVSLRKCQEEENSQKNQ